MSTSNNIPDPIIFHAQPPKRHRGLDNIGPLEVKSWVQYTRQNYSSLRQSHDLTRNASGWIAEEIIRQIESLFDLELYFKSPYDDSNFLKLKEIGLSQPTPPTQPSECEWNLNEMCEMKNYVQTKFGLTIEELEAVNSRISPLFLCGGNAEFIYGPNQIYRKSWSASPIELSSWIHDYDVCQMPQHLSNYLREEIHLKKAVPTCRQIHHEFETLTLTLN